MGYDFDRIRRDHPIEDVLRGDFGLRPKFGKYCCPFHPDKTPSANIFRAKDGVPRFRCHSCEVTLDVIQLIERRYGVDTREAIGILEGESPPRTDHQPRQEPPRDKAEEPEIDLELGPPPADAPRIVPGRSTGPLIRRNGKINKGFVPDAVYPYHDPEGFLVGLVVRLIEEGRKSTPPIRWSRAKSQWALAGWLQGGEQPPLYNAPELAQRPSDPVLMVEGEKCADAARAAFPGFVVATWLGGSGASRYRDFSQLKGRHVLLWPDHDPKGELAMRRVQDRSEAAEVEWLEPSPDWREGYDVADLLEEQGAEAALEWIEGRRVKAEPTRQEKRLETREQLRIVNETGQFVDLRAHRPADWLPQGEFLYEKGPADKREIDYRAEENLRKALLWHPRLKDRITYDLFERQVMVVSLDDPRRIEPFTADKAGELKEEIRRYSGMHGKDAKALYTYILGFANGRQSNRFGDEIRALARHWDGVERDLLAYAGVEMTPWAQVAGRRWMIGLAARVMNPGHEHHGILVLEGMTGAGKSRFYATLGQLPWRKESVHLVLDDLAGDEELAKHMMGIAIAELAEMTAHRKGDRGKFKDRISRPKDRYREKYGIDFITAHRCAVFAATTDDPGAYLDDPNSNRRFWPVRVPADHRIDLDILRRDVVQLWAEASWHAQHGEPNWLQPDEERLQAQAAGRRELDRPELATVERVIEEIGRSGFMGSDDFWNHCGMGPRERASPTLRKPYLDALAGLGWQWGQDDNGTEIKGDIQVNGYARRVRGFRLRRSEG